MKASLALKTVKAGEHECSSSFTLHFCLKKKDRRFYNVELNRERRNYCPKKKKKLTPEQKPKK